MKINVGFQTPENSQTEKVDEEAQLAQSRLLWISGVDKGMKAGDFRKAFLPFGKGLSNSQTLIFNHYEISW